MGCTTGGFTLTGNLNIGRAVHTATLLNNGMVLIAGGYDINGNAVASAELYNPATGTFAVTGNLNTPRYDGAQGTLLSNGMVLLAGGQDNNGNTVASAELYDPSTGNFTLTGNMSTTRQSFTTTLLNSGQVLIASGMDFYANVLSSAELYQPATLAPVGLVSVAVNPSNPLVSLSGTQIFTATGGFSDNSTQTLDSVTWTSSDTSIATIANDAGNRGTALALSTGSVTINACAGSICGANTMTVTSLPSVISLTPNSGAVGTGVTISGINFGASQGTSTVTFNGAAGTPTSWSGTNIVVPVPVNATSGNVVVTVGGIAANGVSFTVLPTPSITNLSTTSATIGAFVTISGSNFGDTQGASTVTFNGIVGTPTNWGSSSVVVPVPVGATTGNVLVTVNGVPSNAVSITITLFSLPPVSQVQPANGTSGFPENGRIIVRLAQPIQSSALSPGSVSIAQGASNVVGTIALSNDGLSVTFEPAQSLAANSAFTVSVTDLAGNQTTPEFQSTFTTGTTTDNVAPTVVQTNPQNSSTGVPISAPIVFQFSKPMDPSTLTPQSFTVTDPIEGHVSGLIQVDPTGTTASFIPQGFLAVGRTFSVNVSSIAEDYAGNSVQGNGTSFTFATAFTADTTAPRMVGTSPSSGSTAVPLNALIILEFSKPIDVISVSKGLSVVSDGQPVPGAIALSNSNQQVTFTPL